MRLHGFVNLLSLIQSMLLGRPCLQFSNGPISTDKHIYIYIHTSHIVESYSQSWKEPQRSCITMSSFYSLENQIPEELVLCPRPQIGPLLRTASGLKVSVLCSSSTLCAFCTLTPTYAHIHWYRGSVCVFMYTFFGARRSHGKSPGGCAQVLVQL